MKIEVIDLFCGVGGLTYGIQSTGIKVLAGIDNDKSCKFPYEYNNKSKYICEDIRKISAKDLDSLYHKNTTKVLVGCAPCQPFSQMRFKYGDESNEEDTRYDLLSEFGRLIINIQPDIISMENVPKIRKTNVFKTFIETLKNNDYFIDYKVIYCPDYGIPQNRRRLVLLAAKNKKIEILPPTHSKANYVTVKEIIGKLPKISAGEIDINDPLHQTGKLSEINIKRIRLSKPGGTWKDWPEDLRCECHKKDSGKTYSSVYGRMSWDKIAPTMTTQFYCYGTGRYGHPEQDRALTLREGALIQTFPIDYQFVEKGKSFALKDVARQIGNAVPVKLGEIIGQSIKEYLRRNKR